MRVNGIQRRTIWPGADGASVEIIDQTRLPHDFVIARLGTVDEAAHAIRSMLVRGAPLIGATAAYGLWLALRADPSDASLGNAGRTLLATRPTAVNLRWAIDRMTAWLGPLPPARRAAAALQRAAEICEEDVAINRSIGAAGLHIIRARAARQAPGAPVNILT
jgi:methylthioribose-1-phosphate isomerase